MSKGFEWNYVAGATISYVSNVFITYSNRKIVQICKIIIINKCNKECTKINCKNLILERNIILIVKGFIKI